EFIADIVNDPTSLTLVKSIVDIAHNFKFKVVAEGVESEEQGAILNDMGCNFGQGFYYHRPQPLSELVEAPEQIAEKKIS
ncbi:MAG: EAL domain-containing protein, partial [Motiliproteus sp.]|nr:EAL domain-containing protein [Motiliproteus sp.]